VTVTAAACGDAKHDHVCAGAHGGGVAAQTRAEGKCAPQCLYAGCAAAVRSTGAELRGVPARAAQVGEVGSEACPRVVAMEGFEYGMAVVPDP